MRSMNGHSPSTSTVGSDVDELRDVFTGLAIHPDIQRLEDGIGNLTVVSSAQSDISSPITSLRVGIEELIPFSVIFNVMKKLHESAVNVRVARFEASLLERDPNAYSNVSATHLDEYIVKVRAAGVPICRKRMPYGDIVRLDIVTEWLLSSSQAVARASSDAAATQVNYDVLEYVARRSIDFTPHPALCSHATTLMDSHIKKITQDLYHQLKDAGGIDIEDEEDGYSWFYLRLLHVVIMEAYKTNRDWIQFDKLGGTIRKLYPALYDSFRRPRLTSFVDNALDQGFPAVVEVLPNRNSQLLFPKLVKMLREREME